MSITAGTLTWEALAEAIAAASEYSTLQEAIDAGIVITGNQAVTGMTVVQGGAAIATSSGVGTALDLAKASQLAASGAEVSTASLTLLKTSTGFKLGGLMTMEMGAIAAVAAPLAGCNLGADLYQSNPALWTKISQTLLPFCYADDKIHAFLDFVKDPLTSKYSPIVTVPTAIIDALKQLFADENVHFDTTQYTYKDSLGRTVSMTSPPPVFDTGEYWEYRELVSTTGSPKMYICRSSGYDVLKIIDGSATYNRRGNIETLAPGRAIVAETPSGARVWPGVPINDMSVEAADDIINEPDVDIGVFPPTAGVSAPTTPVEPIVWPGTPIIVVPDPLGPDYQPIPVTPVTPLPLPAPDPVPLLPEHVPDPTPDKPEEWPEEEPWPQIAPFPYTDPDPSTEPGPDPNWPEVMPWPLPENPPEEWPTHPEPWEWPEELPWPHYPEEWPDDVPWPDAPPDPEVWPDGVPWPDTPEDWPDEVPWPVPWPEDWPNYPPSWPEPYPDIPWPDSPEDWPTEVPWPETPPKWWPEEEPWPTNPSDWPPDINWPKPPSWPIPWPEEVPYPIPYTYPETSPVPYPDPETIENPEQQVDPYIDPWPVQFPEPYTESSPEPDPYKNPSQPESKSEPKPDTESQPEPDDPYPTPPTGTPEQPQVPYVPLPFSSTTGLISVYHPTQSELLSFAQWLWVTWQDASIDKVWNNPFDGVITLFELYCTPTDVGRKNIRSGFLDSGISSETISRYTEINCGSIGVPEYYGNYFDYAPYSKCHVFLPFIGIVELNVDDVVGHGVNITYRIDEYNGSCIAMITCAKSTIVNGEEVDYSTIVYQFSGNCAVELPIAGGSQAAIKAGMLEAAAWGLGSVIGGILGGDSVKEIGQGLAYGAGSAVHSVVSAKSSVQHSGSFGSSYGAMGGKIPYIIVTRPKQIQVPNYNELYGYQAHKMVKVGNCTGYLRCREVHVISPTASDEEKAQIEQLLKTGVYITE